jgi:trk system potassium uptake protein TrkA
VVAISREGRLFVPRSVDQLIAGDLAYVVTATDHVRRTLGLFGHDEQEATRILIAGGGNIGLYVAQTLEKRQSRTRVKIIESGRERAIAIADELRRTVVLHGSALDQKLLLEADIDDTDLMVAVTNDDQVNILSSVMAKRLGCRSNLALINDPSYQEFTHTLGIDAQVNPRSVTISRVLQHVRRGRIRAVHSIGKGTAEIIEAEAMETSPLVGTSLRDLNLPSGIRIGAIYRNGTVLRPSGEFQIKAKDRVVMFAMAEGVKSVEQMFRVSLEFF